VEGLHDSIFFYAIQSNIHGLQIRKMFPHILLNTENHYSKQKSQLSEEKTWQNEEWALGQPAILLT
jgi:hypothetical protein